MRHIRHLAILLTMLLLAGRPASAAEAAGVAGMWGTTDTSAPDVVAWPADWPGARNLRAQWFKILADDPRTWVFEAHAKGEPPGSTYYLWRGDRPLPQGTRLLLEGDFPHCRMFDIQFGAPWDPRMPSFGDGRGIPEIALLDEDIVPDPGHVNPFRPGADRNAAKRHFHLTCELRDGNPVTLNPHAGVPPYRAPGNLRIGGTRHGPQGEFGPYLWIRVYLPDRYQPFAGVEPPVLRIQLPGQEPVLAPPCRHIGLNNTMFLPPYGLADNPAAEDGTSAKEREANARLAELASTALDANGPAGSATAVARLSTDPDGVVWLAKVFTTARYILSLQALAKGDTDALHRGVPSYLAQVYGMGRDLPPPGNDEHSSDHCNYHTYLLGTVALKPGSCLVIRGKLPQIPRTLDGRSACEPSDQLRYFGITLQGGKPTKRTPVVSLVDEELYLDADRRYTVVVSAAQDRPANATPEHGITWRPWPLGDVLAINVRVTSTADTTWKHAPQLIGWAEGDFGQPTFDRMAVRTRMGEYFPAGCYMARAEVEALGEASRGPFAASYPTPQGAYGRRAGPAATAQPNTIVATPSGPVIGELYDGVRAFRGIPYAAPPLGMLRWRPPQPPAAWTSPRRCLAFAPACPQQGKDLYGPVGATSEDCLYLNVWTPARDHAARLPVMVWLHGGGFLVGAGGKPCYDGAELARRGGVVVVSINYRLGPFGFLAHPALSAEAEPRASGNYGLMDQAAALRWVRDSIAAFGGDPGCVTIFGQSSGGVSVCALMASPLAQGLFHRAIVHSGSAPPGLRSLAVAEEHGVAFAARLGAADLAALRAAPVSALLAAAKPATGKVGQGTYDHLCQDGAVLTAPLDALFAAGRQAAVPTMVGTTRDEDPLFLRGAQAVLKAMAPVQAKTWAFRFERVSPFAARKDMGSFHGAELPYVFRFFPPALGFTADDEALSGRMISYWSRFARTGDPNGGPEAAWKAWDPAGRHVHILGL